MIVLILKSNSAKTATLIGGRIHTIDSTDTLRTQLATDTSDVNMVMAHKFQQRDTATPLKVAEALGTYLSIPSAETFGIVNSSPRIVLMIDEAHRTQGSDLGDNIFEAFPNAARIAFTGTPLITDRHGEKKTHKRFGDYIDTYRLMDAVADGTTLQILYEGRTADAALNDKHGFETQFEKPLQRPYPPRTARYQEEIRRNRRPARSRNANRGDRPRPGRSLPTAHFPQRL